MNEFKKFDVVSEIPKTNVQEMDDEQVIAEIAARKQSSRDRVGDWHNCDHEHYYYTCVQKNDKREYDKLYLVGWRDGSGEEYRTGFDGWRVLRKSRKVSEYLRAQRHARIQAILNKDVPETELRRF